MTATTVGLGDISPITPSGRVFAVAHMTGSFMLFASLLETVGSVPAVRELETKLAQLRTDRTDPEFLARIDKNGDGVDRYEFVVGMLIQLGKVSEDDVRMLDEQFDEVDVDKCVPSPDLCSPHAHAS